MLSVRSRRIMLTLFTVLAVQSVTLAESWTGTIGWKDGDAVSFAQPMGLATGESVEISARVARPGRLPDNGRVRVSIVAIRSTGKASAAGTEREVVLSKVLHALDGDFFTVFTARNADDYRVELTPECGDVTLFEGDRWRETGFVDEQLAAARQVPWKDGQTAAVSVSVRKIADTVARDGSLVIESEPNNSAADAQQIPLRATADDYTLQIVGTSDDIEYFDNGQVGTGIGDDWLRLDFDGPEPRLLTACLTIPDQLVAARVRCYALPKDKATVKPGETLDVGGEYEDGKNSNERVHQQAEQHRIAINRNLQPGHVYFLRVEANTPGYGLELRIVKPAPFDDPRQAVRHALYDHLGQVSSWLNNRPRGASVERRLRDTGNLLGTHCMSCHTQSGVWGPAIPFAQGYRTPNMHLFRDLTNICYQSLRPTNELIEAANNTSLAPLDIGDGPAGTRVAGHSVVSLERFMPPRKLHSMQHLRASNFILQTGDPGGINAAGPGANVGKGVVFNYAGEIVFEAWKRTGNPQFFRAMEDKARRTLDVDPKYTDDLAHRVEQLSRYFPTDYVAQVENVLKLEAGQGDAKPKVPSNIKPGGSVEDATILQERITKQVAADIARLRAVQNEDGTWGFNPGKADGGSWKLEGDNKPEPSPTALALIAFEAAGLKPDDPTVKQGVKGLLGLQHPSGYWKGQSQTGFVSTSYALHALSRLFPVELPKQGVRDFAAATDETLPETIDRVRRAAIVDEPELLPVLLKAAEHASPLVRFWAMMGLGVRHADAGVKPLVAALGDVAKPVREAAHWGLRQTLIDDRGWKEVLAATKSSDDYVREAVAQTLVMRVDGVLPEVSVAWDDLTAAITQGMNSDSHPAVRAWSTRAAWNWWIWNPPVRQAINAGWIELLQRPESNSLVENAVRYQSQALFIANGHKANSSGSHQYPQLAELFGHLEKTLKDRAANDPVVAQRLARRLIGVGATYYNNSGGDGGPGQMGYVTKGAAELFGAAAMNYFADVEQRPNYLTDTGLLRVGLEGAANVTFDDLQQKLIQYSLEGPEDLRPIAAASVSDPRSAQLVAVPERIEPLMQQVHRGANEPARRPQLSEPILKMFATITWVIPDNLEQQREVFSYLMVKPDKFLSDADLKSVVDAGERGRQEQIQESNWYLARKLGDAIGANPDLHRDAMIEYLASDFSHPQIARFWLPSVEWLLTHKTRLPDVVPGKLPPIDPLEEVRTRAVQLFVEQLKEAADPDTRKTAVTLAQRTALRRNPEVLTALETLLTFEKRDDVINAAKNVLSQNRNNFVKELTDVVKAEKPVIIDVGSDGLTQDFVDDFAYFRDYVTPEMNRVLRGDQRSCFACHGVPGRVPPLELHRPDDAGYLSVARLLENYRKLQKRVDHNDVEKSFLLRKPLNVQTGQEEGHQGGRRYQPMDTGYLILRKWVLNQAKNRAKLGG
ncbi:MAG: hypothetical protein O3B13_00020 [Planctomycetota bacterium]|nr:hypothetical protein [Planctomycetota bacterium]